MSASISKKRKRKFKSHKETPKNNQVKLEVGNIIRRELDSMIIKNVMSDNPISKYLGKKVPIDLVDLSNDTKKNEKIDSITEIYKSFTKV